MQELEKQSWPENVSFLDGGTFTQDIFFLFEKFDHLLVLDAVRGGQAPGTIYRLEEKDLTVENKQNVSVHDVDLMDSLRMAELMGSKPEITVLGIEPEVLAWEMGLTKTLEQALPGFVKIAGKEIQNILKQFELPDPQ